MKILVTGATGFIGRRVVAALARQRHEVLRLSRAAADAADARLFHWDPSRNELDPRALEGVDAVIHLAGENLSAKRWSPVFKAQILDSRVQGTRMLVEAIAKLPAKPKYFLAAGAIGFYGIHGAEELSEENPGGADFLAQVCQAWEAEALPLDALGVRRVQMRFGMVLGAEGGALRKMLLPFRLGLGGRIGDGAQYYSWISADDLISAILFFMDHPETSGVYNCVSPNPVTNTQFTASLARAVGRPAYFPMPAFAARLAFGEMADALLLGGQRVSPSRLKEAGFQWEHPFIGEALNKLLHG